MSILVQNIVKKYGEQIAVDDISFSLPEKKIIGFLGPNGAGKSTTMKMLNGFLTPDEGTIFVAGISVNSYPLQAQKKIGYLPEHNPLYVDFYISEYLEIIANIHGIRQAKKKIEEVMHQVGLTPERNKKINQLSKGYRQRVGIASVLLHDPEVLILDEPTSGLDPNQVAEIRGLLKQLSSTKTILFSTHILQEAESLCQELIIINKGKILAHNSLQAIQREYSSAVIIAQFQKEVQREDFQLIEKKCSKITKKNSAWHIETQHKDDIKKAIIQLAHQNQWGLESIFDEQNSLEHIFSNLTTSASA